MNPLTITGAFLVGAITMASFVIGLFFIKFYLRTRDRLLLLFGNAFLLLGVERILLMGVSQEYEARSFIYFIRLVAFSMIIIGIVLKNRESKQF
ncbi:MAG TPA: DUF5985 family protein [Pseudobdellovibrionaceae bacterium]|nr:DUF5985 family protein [Pseudobdellovibrionaceae bacterium]